MCAEISERACVNERNFVVNKDDNDYDKYICRVHSSSFPCGS